MADPYTIIPSDISGWISSGEAARRLRCSGRWILVLIAAERLNAIKTPLGHLIDPASVDAYLYAKGQPRYDNREIATALVAHR